MAPRDPDGGGTWLAANELGLTVGVLNAWTHDEALEPAGGFESRGLLVLALAEAGSAVEVRRRLERRDLRAVRGFRLVVFALGEEPLVLAWNGERLTCERAEPPLSSSVVAAEAAHARARVFEELAGDGAVTSDVLERFQASHLPQRGPLSPCMHRADARTVSASRVTVGPSGVSFAYAPGPPCTAVFGAPVVLPLRAGAGRA